MKNIVQLTFKAHFKLYLGTSGQDGGIGRYTLPPNTTTEEQQI